MNNNIINKIMAERQQKLIDGTCSQHKLTKQDYNNVSEWLFETFNSFDINVNRDEVVITIGI